LNTQVRSENIIEKHGYLRTVQYENKGHSLGLTDNLSAGSPKHGKGSYLTVEDINIDNGFSSGGEDNEDELEDGDFAMSMRSNFGSMILTANKESLFNNSIRQFNDVKHGPSECLSQVRTPKSSMLLSFSSPSRYIDAPGPRNITEMASPKPKERSFDEVEDDEDECVFDKVPEKTCKQPSLTNFNFKTEVDKENMTTHVNVDKNFKTDSGDEYWNLEMRPTGIFRIMIIIP
jgi:hypothetical protein